MQSSKGLLWSCYEVQGYTRDEQSFSDNKADHSLLANHVVHLNFNMFRKFKVVKQGTKAPDM